VHARAWLYGQLIAGRLKVDLPWIWPGTGWSDDAVAEVVRAGGEVSTGAAIGAGIGALSGLFRKGSDQRRAQRRENAR